MSTLYNYIKSYLDEDFNWKYYLLISIFLGSSIYVNYYFDFENSVLKSYARMPIQNLFVFVYYTIPFYFASVFYALFYKNSNFLQSTKYWTISLFGILILTINETFYLHSLLIESTFNTISEVRFVKKCANNLISALIYFLPLYIFWWKNNKAEMPFYGFSKTNFNFKPYLVMYLGLIPLIIFASYQKDFQITYPIYNDFGAYVYWEIPEFINLVVFEIAYGLDYVMVETFFRGFLILALAKNMGKAAIMPMVCLYCYFHFGKPMFETVSSIFGGFVLGIIAYKTRSIYGGICVHLGVAYSMEIAAYLQKIKF